MAPCKHRLGLIGVGVMGGGLALNLADRGVRVLVYDRVRGAGERLAARFPEAVACASSLNELVDGLERPRAILLMVPAGDAAIQGGRASTTKNIAPVSLTVSRTSDRASPSGPAPSEAGAAIPDFRSWSSPMRRPYTFGARVRRSAMNKQSVTTPGWQLEADSAEAYERYLASAFRPWVADLIALAGLKPRERVLDAACGTGIVARSAAPIVHLAREAIEGVVRVVHRSDAGFREARDVARGAADVGEVGQAHGSARPGVVDRGDAMAQVVSVADLGAVRIDDVGQRGDVVVRVVRGPAVRVRHGRQPVGL